MVRVLDHSSAEEVPDATYQCSDGTDFPVRWFAPDDPSFVWTRNVTHFPLLETPLAIAIRDLSVPERLRIFEEAGLQVPYSFAHDLIPQGFVYLNSTGGTPDNDAQRLAVEGLLEKWGSTRRFWNEYCLPSIERACHGLQTEAGSWTLLELTNAWARGLFTTQVAFQVILHRMNVLRDFLTAELGPEGELLSTDLTSGHDNATSNADQALCDLATLALGFPAVRDALADGDGDVSPDALRGVEGGPRFLESFGKFLDVYGWRTESWQIVAPALRERPEAMLRQVQQLLLKDYRSPDETMPAIALRREAAIQETLARLPPAKRAELNRLLELDAYVFIREGRAFWQLNSFGSLRHAVLLRGERLHSEGLIEAPADVLFLLPAELEAALAGDRRPLADVITARKAERTYWQTKEEPETVGAPPKAAPSEIVLVEGIIVRGVGSSRGVVTGRARILESVDDGERLQPGDVIVCRMTSPVWAPLFAIAGAVVTDSGGMLMHMSITAREYGIPCVCATKTATKLIPDGALIRVDGMAGTIELLERATEASIAGA